VPRDDQLTKTSPRAGRAATRCSDGRPSARTGAGARVGGAARRAGFEAVRTVVALARGVPGRATRASAARAATEAVDARVSDEADGTDAAGGGRIGVAAASVVVGARLDGAVGSNVGDPALDGSVRASIVAEANGKGAGTAATDGATDAGAIGAGAVP
jgi:hypothetical protein